MRRTPATVLLMLLLSALSADSPIRAEDDGDPEVGRLLRLVREEDDADEWKAAVRDLRERGGEAAQRLERALADLAQKRRQALVAQIRKLRALVAKIPGSTKGNLKRLEAWDRAREHAHEWIFSRHSFPDIDGPIFGPKEGYDEAMTRAKAAIGRYAQVTRLVGRTVSAAMKLDAKEAKAIREAHDAARRAYVLVTSEITTKTEQDESEITAPGAAWLFLEIRERKWKSAAPRIRGLPRGIERLCAFEIYSRTILEWNGRNPLGQSKPARRALVSLNRYRMALGISPLAHNERLVKMATAHSKEMSRLGYLGHESPVLENHGMRDRAEKVGYRSHVEECVSGRSSASTAVETWKWDGGHHRIMVSGAHTEAGIGDKGPCTLNVGAGEKGAPPPVRY